MSENNYEVLLFYKYIEIDDPKKLSDDFRNLCIKHNLLGRVIIAGEGINATLEGEKESTEVFVSDFKVDPRFADLWVKKSQGDGRSFSKLSVKVRPEIVSTKLPKTDANPTEKTAKRLSVDELRSWYETNKDFMVIDMRNDYEIESGYFKNTVNPGMKASRDLPETLNKLDQYKTKKVLAVCTGGVRCEKMSAYLLNKGFEDIYQLEGGIHTYMEKYPGKDFLGTLYTFDKRLTMHFGGDREVVGKCRLCGTKSERYVNCANLSCHLHFIVCNDCAPKDEMAYCGDSCRTVNV